MKSDDNIDIVSVSIVAMLLLAVIMIVGGIVNGNKTAKGCESKGGQYVGFKGGYICTKDGLIIESSK